MPGWAVLFRNSDTPEPVQKGSFDKMLSRCTFCSRIRHFLDVEIVEALLPDRRGVGGESHSSAPRRAHAGHRCGIPPYVEVRDVRMGHPVSTIPPSINCFPARRRRVLGWREKHTMRCAHRERLRASVYAPDRCHRHSRHPRYPVGWRRSSEQPSTAVLH